MKRTEKEKEEEKKDEKKTPKALTEAQKTMKYKTACMLALGIKADDVAHIITGLK
jgi:hypothetical protein